MKKAVGLLVC